MEFDIFQVTMLIDKKNRFHSSLNFLGKQQGLAEPRICVCIDTLSNVSIDEATDI